MSSRGAFRQPSFVVAMLNVAIVLAHKAAMMAGKTKMSRKGNTMKWRPYMSTFVLKKMCEIISSGPRTDKGFKEVRLNGQRCCQVGL